MKIRTMFIFSLIFFAISSIITYAIYCCGTMNSLAEKQYERLYSDIALNESKNISEYVKSAVSSASVVAYDEKIRNYAFYDAEEKNEALESAKGYLSSQTGIVRIVVIQKANGVVSMSASDETALSYEPFDNKMMSEIKEGNAYISAVLDNNNKAAGYEIVSPVMLDDRTILVYFSNTYIDSIIKAGSFPTNGQIAVMDGLDHIVDSAYVGVAEEISSKRGYAKYNFLIEAANNADILNDSIRFEAEGTPRISYTVQAPDCGWYVTAIAEADKAYEFSSSASVGIVWLVAVLSVIFIGAYIIAVIIVTKPLVKIEDALMKISRGDHSLRIGVSAKNEYGEIASAFNTLIESLAVNERRYHTIVELSEDIAFDWNLKTNSIVFSNNFNKKFSYRPPSDNFSDSFFVKGRVHPEDNKRYREDLAALEKGEELRDKTYRWKNVYGDYVWISVNTSTIRDNEGNIVRIIGVLSDVDRNRREEMQLTQNISYDALTGVYDRETVESALNEEIRKVAGGNDGFAVLYIDIDNFKIYNNKYSHATGDQVLKFVADSISEIVEDFGFVGRYGGDEFIVCIRNSSTNIPENVVKDITAKLKEGFRCNTDADLSVNVSIGTCNVKNSEKTLETIIDVAKRLCANFKKR